MKLDEHRRSFYVFFIQMSTDIFLTSLHTSVVWDHYSVLPEAFVVFRKEPLVLPVLHFMQNPFLFHFEVCLVHKNQNQFGGECCDGETEYEYMIAGYDGLKNENRWFISKWFNVQQSFSPSPFPLVRNRELSFFLYGHVLTTLPTSLRIALLFYHAWSI